MILADVSMFPLDKGASVSSYVARSLKIIEASGLPYRMGPMGTTIEGEWGEVMEVVTRCYERMQEDCDRIECMIKIDARKGPGGRLERKIESVEEKVGHKLKS